MGHDLISDSAARLGYYWIRWLFIFAEGVTAAAVLRAAGHIFFGWGPHADSTAGKTEEKPETKGGRRRTPATMFIPAVVLLSGGMLLAFVPQFQPSTLRAAGTFDNSSGYGSHVLEGLAFPKTRVPLSNAPAETVTALLTVLGAIAVAILDLSSTRVRQISARLAVPLKVVHRIHSGNVIDYVIFLTIGMAAFGLICSYFVL
jgi:hypothetical protein